MASKLRQLEPSEVLELEPGTRERLQAAAAAMRVASMEEPLKGGDGDTSTLAELLSADEPDPLEAAGAELELERLRALLPADLELLETVVSLGYRAAAVQRGEPISRLKANAERARQRLRMVA